MYTVGAIRNAEIAKELFPDWICRYYVANDVPDDIVTKLESMSNTEVIKRDTPGSPNLMFWRFEPAFDPTVEYMISRDTDSRLGVREKSAVDEWISSGKKYHIMRDHPYHNMPVMGGMWGCMPTMPSSVNDEMKTWLRENEDKKNSDQKFLYMIFGHSDKTNVFKDEDTCVHDQFWAKIPFPMERSADPMIKFVGQPFDENDEYTGNWEEDLKELREKFARNA